ncbi:MAG TPA: response regulator [Gammaproteobacteria bacterium]|nr:response regulator [Gammaproteobacteria bacterium]
MSDADRSSTILIVDDERFNLNTLIGILQGEYRLLIAKSGEQALARLATPPLPQLILLDILMPGIDGYETCRRIKENPDTASIPVIFITTKTTVEDEQHGLELGAADYITKPFSPAIIKARIRTQLKLKRALDALKDQNQLLERKVAERTLEIALTRDVAIHGMAALAGTRDHETGNHIRRTQHYIRLLARHLSDRPRFREFLTEQNIDTMFRSAPLHDIGKVGIPDNILLKPGRLDREEFEVMKTHATLGRDALPVDGEHPGSIPFLSMARDIAHTHHEKWDGSGYPQGLKETDIPLPGRLMAIADVYDALINERVYKPPFSHETAVEIIQAGREKQFDPEVVDGFLQLQEEFHEISRQFSDPPSTGAAALI